MNLVIHTLQQNPTGWKLKVSKKWSNVASFPKKERKTIGCRIKQICVVKVLLPAVLKITPPTKVVFPRKTKQKVWTKQVTDFILTEIPALVRELSKSTFYLWHNPVMRRSVTKIQKKVTASQQNLVLLHNRPSGHFVCVRLCVSMCVCVSRCTAGPPARYQWERQITSLATASVGGPAFVSVIHSPLVGTPLPSIPLLCHCLQTLPAASVAPMHQAQAHQAAAIGDGSTTC